MEEFGQSVADFLGMIDVASARVDTARIESRKFENAADHFRIKDTVACNSFEDRNVAFRQSQTGRTTRFEP